MVAPTLSPERLERLAKLADASRLRAALYPPPKPPPARRRSRSRQYPGGRPNPRRARRSRGVSGYGGLHRAPGTRTAERTGAEPTGRVEPIVTINQVGVESTEASIGWERAPPG
ncbi:hypothetical protein ACF07T_39040 [Streptomyces sp. NPDC015184]|uniref:hypothetical protein n=1 Tax=Streptomyces sp. NPDC015184 TaxID=3364946 RepID=UPI0036FD9DDE